MFDFRRITLFCLGYRLSKTNVLQIWWGYGPVVLRPGYAFVSDTIVPLAILVLVAASRGLSCIVSSGIQFLFLL